MRCKKGDIIRAGNKYFSVYGVLGNVVYVKQMLDVNSSPSYKWEDVLKNYRKIEIMGE